MQPFRQLALIQRKEWTDKGSGEKGGLFSLSSQTFTLGDDKRWIWEPCLVALIFDYPALESAVLRVT